MSDGGTTKKFGQIFLWVVTTAFGVLMLVAGGSKFMQPEMWVSNFEGWGYPGVLAYVIGALEVVGAVALFVPRLATYAGALIAVIMCVAAATLIMNPGPLGPPTIPLINVIGFAGIAYARRGQRWTP